MKEACWCSPFPPFSKLSALFTHLILIQVGEHELLVSRVDHSGPIAGSKHAVHDGRAAAGSRAICTRAATTAAEGPQQNGLGAEHKLLALADCTCSFQK